MFLRLPARVAAAVLLPKTKRHLGVCLNSACPPVPPSATHTPARAPPARSSPAPLHAGLPAPRTRLLRDATSGTRSTAPTAPTNPQIRVLSRLRRLAGDPTKLGAVHSSLAEQLLDRSRPGCYNQVHEGGMNQVLIRLFVSAYGALLFCAMCVKGFSRSTLTSHTIISSSHPSRAVSALPRRPPSPTRTRRRSWSWAPPYAAPPIPTAAPAPHAACARLPRRGGATCRGAARLTRRTRRG
jgi:hypothetical protein